MKLICGLINTLLIAVTALAFVLIATAWRGYQIVAITETVAKNHLVEKGNGKAWPATITGLFGEITKTSDSVRKSADTVQSLLEKDGPQTALSVRNAAAGVAATSASVGILIAENGPQTAKALRDAAGTVNALLTADGPATAQSIRDAAAGVAGTATSVQKLIADNGPQTAKSIRDAANTANTLLATEGPATAASVRKATDSGAEISASWAKISQSLESWIDRMTAPPTVKQKIEAIVHALIVALAHWL